MDFFTALKQNINEYIVANGNKEITADILRPILLEICNITFAKMGDLELLQTVYKNDLVGAINEALNAESGVKIHYGTFPDPNDATITNFELGDFYAQQGDTGIDSFWQYNGQSWVKIADSDSQSGVQSVTGDGVDNTDPENPVLTFPTPAEIGAIEDAPSDGKTYGRKDENWDEIVIPSSGVQTVTGDGVSGTPEDVVLSFPTASEIGAQEQFTTDESLYLDPITNELRANVSDFSEKYTYTSGAQEFVLTSTPTKIIFISVNGQLLEDPLTQWSIDVPTKTITILDEMDAGDRVTVHYQYFIEV